MRQLLQAVETAMSAPPTSLRTFSRSKDPKSHSANVSDCSLESFSEP